MPLPASCHTAVVGAYFLEGQAPIADLEGLVRKALVAKGLAVRGTSAGSPAGRQAGLGPCQPPGTGQRPDPGMELTKRRLRLPTKSVHAWDWGFGHLAGSGPPVRRKVEKRQSTQA
ncbi:DUF411 domain-containing protein [Brevundimonas sp.]|uniref:DUF411 domain-containing protein n=1 Tax=Brevundimonas sp. TaxID=1871086 RepID=UPI003AFF83B3